MVARRTESVFLKSFLGVLSRHAVVALTAVTGGAEAVLRKDLLCGCCCRKDCECCDNGKKRKFHFLSGNSKSLEHVFCADSSFAFTTALFVPKLLTIKSLSFLNG